MPTVSIVVPAYNAEETLPATLSSIFLQGFSDYECFIVDDHSTDKTSHIAIAASEIDSRFRFIQLAQNQGVVAARNAALAQASGRYIAFLDSDDLWHPSFLDNSLAVHAQHFSGLVHSSYYRFRSNPASPVTLFASVTPPEIVDASNILSKNHLPLLSVVVDRDAVGDFLFPSARPEDYSLWSELIYGRGHKSISTKRYLGFYRISDNQRSSNKLKAFPRVYAFYKSFSSLPKHMALLYCARWAAINVYQRRFSRFCPDPIAETCFSHILEHSLAFGTSI